MIHQPALGRETGSLNKQHAIHTATLLPDGQVLVAGGFALYDGADIGELYDPTTSAWGITGNLVIPRQNHTATLLLDGDVLIAGGGNDRYKVFASAELYDSGN